MSPGVAAGGGVCAFASVAMKPVISHSAQPMIPLKPRLVSMASSLDDGAARPLMARPSPSGIVGLPRHVANGDFR